MFSFKSKKVGENSIRYCFTNKKNRYLSYKNFIENLLQENENFLKVFFESLEDATWELDNYFWECIPVSRETIDKRFEFVVTKSISLERNEKRDQEFLTFKDHLVKSEDDHVTSFLNLGKDAILIVPIPKRINKRNFVQYKNISQFIMNSHKFPDQQISFWKEVAIRLNENLKDNIPLWLSTDGLGVNYLHVRIDFSPKYYSWKEYRKEELEVKQTSKKEKKKRNFEEYNSERSREGQFQELHEEVHLKRAKLGRESVVVLSLVFVVSIFVSYFSFI